MDEELIIECQNGDEKAFKQLIEYTRPLLYKLAKIKIKKDLYIDDIISNTEFIIYKEIKKLKEPKSYKYWVIRIFTNECNKLYSRIKHEKELNEKSIQNFNYYDYSIEELENNKNFEDLIKDLDEDEKQIFRLYFYDNYTLKEISELLSINNNTTKSKFRRGKEKIRKFIYNNKILIVFLISVLIITSTVVAITRIATNKENYSIIFNSNRINNIESNFINDKFVVEIDFNEKINENDFSFNDDDAVFLIDSNQKHRFYPEKIEWENDDLRIEFGYNKDKLPVKMNLYIKPIKGNKINILFKK